MAPKPPLLFRLALFGCIGFFSALILYFTQRNVDTAAALADQALESTAVALAASAEGELRGGGESPGQVLSDRIVAYALIAAPDGRIRFHTNAALVGTTLSEPVLERFFRRGRSGGRRVVLGTGSPAYEFQYPLHTSRGETLLLRLVLHAAEVDRIVAQARRLWWVASGVLVVLWALGLALERALTRQFRLREESLRREKLALVGRMTATLAHEIRNALGSVKGFAQWVDEKLGPGDDLKKGLAGILQGSARIEALVEDLLAYAREETFRIGPLPLRQAMEQSLACFAAWPGRVEVSAGQGLRVLADPEKLHRALTNGIRNALEAMGDDGLLRLTALVSGRETELRIEDTGPGLSPESTGRVFTPFFTTKASGTGLGLAYSRKVIEGMGGRIVLGNGERVGARLSIFLPNAARRRAG